MNKAELALAIEGQLGNKKLANDALETVLETIIREVANGGRVSITGFGTFERVERGARTGRNPRTGEAVHIMKTTAPRFRPGTSFRAVVADPRKLTKAPVIGRAAAGTVNPISAPVTTVRKAASKAAPTKASPAKAAPTKVAPAKAEKPAAKKASKKADGKGKKAAKKS